MQRVGVLGGSFDPVHYGHLIAAEEAWEALKLDHVIFMPSGHPPHKDPAGLLPAEVRYHMTRLAVTGHPHFSVSRLEMDRPGPAYTLDTLRLLQAQQPECELYFITGADMFLDLPRWKGPEELLSAFHFVGVTRPGWDIGAIAGSLGRLWTAYRDHLHIIEIPGVAVSSTEIRQRVQEGRSIRYLVPEAVRLYIEGANLYR